MLFRSVSHIVSIKEAYIPISSNDTAIYSLLMEETSDGKNKITILEDLRVQNGATGFDIKIEDVEYYYADGGIDIVNGITVNKGYIKDNPSYINKNYGKCPSLNQPKEILQTKAGMCNNEGEGCYARMSFPLMHDTYNVPVIYFYASSFYNYHNNINIGNTHGIYPYGAGYHTTLPSAKYPVYKVEKVDNGDGTYDYKVEDLRTDDMTGFDYKIIKDVEYYVSYIEGACKINKQDYIIVEKGKINNYNPLDSDGCYYSLDTSSLLNKCSGSDGENCYDGTLLSLSNLNYSSLKSMWAYAYNSYPIKMISQSYTEPTMDYAAANLWKVDIQENGEYKLTDLRDSNKVTGFNSKLVCTKQYDTENNLNKTYYLNVEKGIVKPVESVK